MLQVAAGFDSAENETVKRAVSGDLVVTADVPLAAEIIAKGGDALTPRGKRYSPDTIRGVRIMRDSWIPCTRAATLAEDTSAHAGR